MLPAFSVIMRGTMRPPISTTVSATPRAVRSISRAPVHCSSVFKWRLITA